MSNFTLSRSEFSGVKPEGRLMSSTTILTSLGPSALRDGGRERGRDGERGLERGREGWRERDGGMEREKDRLMDR